MELFEDGVVRKITITMTLKYSIGGSSIQEARSLDIGVVALDSLIGKLTNFDLSHLDNSMPKIEVTFNESMTLVPTGKER